MSISQLDDPSMREALGIETDTPSSFGNRIQLGNGSGAVVVQNGISTTPQGDAVFRSLDGSGNAAAGTIVVNDPTIDTNYANALIAPRSYGFQQALTGTTVNFATFNDDGLGAIALAANNLTANTVAVSGVSGVLTLAGAGGGAALTNIASINGSPVGTTIHNTASTGSYTFASLSAYPTSLWYDTISNRIPNGKKFLLTMCLNFQLLPTAPFIGSDVITIRCGQQTGSPPNPSDNFAEPQIDLIYPDGTAYSRYSFSIFNQVELVSDAAGTWSVIAEALSSAGGHSYNISGTAGVLSIVELFT